MTDAPDNVIDFPGTPKVATPEESAGGLDAPDHEILKMFLATVKDLAFEAGVYGYVIAVDWLQDNGDTCVHGDGFLSWPVKSPEDVDSPVRKKEASDRLAGGVATTLRELEATSGEVVET